VVVVAGAVAGLLTAFPRPAGEELTAPR
jgi:hypothetical protein